MRPIAALLMAFALAPTAGAIDLDACGMVVEPGQTARLTADLDCGPLPEWPFSTRGIRLQPGATLELNGFALRGDGSGVGVECGPGKRARTRACTVVGPGEISGFYAGMNGGGCRMVARDVTIRENTVGVLGPLACRLDAEELTVTDNLEDGVWVWRLRARGLVASGNGDAGIRTGRLAARDVFATGNGEIGVVQFTTRGRLGRLVDSTVLGNVLTDIAAVRVRLRRVECGRSERLRWPPVVDSSDDQPTVVGTFGCRDD